MAPVAPGTALDRSLAAAGRVTLICVNLRRRRAALIHLKAAPLGAAY
ncbi:hypothetical protein ABIE65_001267 [Constrictibacter sp. MBR-5]|jgi:hypothetical protein